MRRRSLEIEKAVKGLRVKESQVALMTLSFYVDGGVEQWERIKKNEEAASNEHVLWEIHRERGDKAKEAEFRERYWALKHQVLLDAHFYFICANKVFELGNEIVKKEKARKLEKFWEIGRA